MGKDFFGFIDMKFLYIEEILNYDYFFFKNLIIYILYDY